jgi:hypothetical protein
MSVNAPESLLFIPCFVITLLHYYLSIYLSQRKRHERIVIIINRTIVLYMAPGLLQTADEARDWSLGDNVDDETGKDDDNEVVPDVSAAIKGIVTPLIATPPVAALTTYPSISVTPPPTTSIVFPTDAAVWPSTIV